MSVRDSIAQLRRLSARLLDTASSLGEDASEPRSVSSALQDMPVRFELREKLGQGGMGVVYRAYDREFGRDVALKSLHRLQSSDLYYLKNEFRALTGIRHPNLVTLYELHAGERTCFFTMELVLGVDLRAYFRQLNGAREWDHVRDVVSQLARALNAVHAEGKLHRDVKPSNVMVTGSGRVVLLDFGLVAALSPEELEMAAGGTLAGTVEYMSPEQARGDALAPASDWYAFGVTLYEAVCNRLPYDGPIDAFSILRQRGKARSLREVAPDVPPDFDALVTALLQADPSERPSAGQILAVLAPDSIPVESRHTPVTPRPSRPPFEGRATELSALGGALQSLKSGKSAIVRVSGPSGVGKTELCRRFTEGCEKDGVTVLRARCHPQESVAFNALDGIVDALSLALSPMADEDVEPLLPPGAATLLRIFPVLASVPAMAAAGGADPDCTGEDLLRLATSILKELLRRFSERVALLLFIDDAQWGDEDSGKLLREILRSPGAPTVLLLLSYRVEDAGGSALLATQQAVLGTGHSYVDLALGPLTEDETLSVVRRASGGAFGNADALLRLVHETQGLPFFAHELARYLVDAESAETSGIRLDAILGKRLEDLSAPARRMVELVSVAGGPLEQSLLLRAAQLDVSARTLLLDLERESLIRSATLGPNRRTEIYHHRIRDAILPRLSPETRRSHHGDIARAMLTSTSPNLPQVVDHFYAAADEGATRRYVVAAAQQAEELLAFDRAAGLYARAIEVGAADIPPDELQTRLAEALGNAGRCREAGAAFERAAEQAASFDARRESVLSLRRRAAEQYLKSWQRDDAQRSLAAVLRPLRITMPRSQADALRTALGNRARIEARFRARRNDLERPELASRDERFETLLTLMQVYAMTDHTYGFAFGSRLLLDALDSGGARDVFHGLAAEAVAWGAIPGKLATTQADRYLRELRRIAEVDRDGYRLATWRLCNGQVLHFRGEFSRALRAIEPGLRWFCDHRRGVTVQVASGFAFYLPGLVYLGRLKEQQQILESELAAAQARGDDYFIATCGAGLSTSSWILCGEKEKATALATRVGALSPPGFSTQRYFELQTRVLCDLHEGKGLSAFTRIDGAWPQLKKNHYLSLSLIGDDLRHLRGRAAIAAAAELQSRREDPGGIQSYLAVALGSSRQLEQGPLPFARGWANLLRAGAAMVQGDRAQAESALTGAITTFDACEMKLYAAAARCALGGFGPSGATLARAGERWMLEASVQDVPAATRMILGWG